MNAAEIEALVNARVAAALATKPRGYEWGDPKPECRNKIMLVTLFKRGLL